MLAKRNAPFAKIIAIFSLVFFLTPTISSASTFPGINGRIIYADTNNYPYYQLKTIKSDGTGATTVGSPSSSWNYPNYSPDGTKIVYTVVQGSYNHIFIANADASNAVQLTSGNNHNIDASFSPDGTKIVYSRQDSGFYQIWRMNIDGSSKTQVLSHSDNCYWPTYSPDGSKILFQAVLGGSGFEIGRINADGTGLTNLTSNSQHDTEPHWSPDGTKIVYSSLPASDYQIYTMNADGSNKTALTSNSYGHYNPAYSPDGTKIVYRGTPGGTIPELFIMNSNGSSQTQITTTGWIGAGIDWQPLTLSPSSSNPNPTVDASSGSAVTINIASLYTDSYGGINAASVTVTTAPTKGTASVNSTTGVITYTPTVTAQSKSFFENLADLLIPTVNAATTDSFVYQVCSSASSSLCSSGTVTLTLASLATTGINMQVISFVGLLLIIAGLAISAKSILSKSRR